MPIALDATVAGEFSNSYCDVAFGDDYFSRHFNSTKKNAWAALTTGQKEEALIQGTMVIEQFKFSLTLPLPHLSDLRYDPRVGRFVAYGEYPDRMTAVKYNYFQYLQFPRNLDIHYSTGVPYIPEQVQRAACEQGYYMLNFDETALANRLQGITLDRAGIGNGAVDATQEYGLGGTMLCPVAHNLIRPYLMNSSRVRRA